MKTTLLIDSEDSYIDLVDSLPDECVEHICISGDNSLEVAKWALLLLLTVDISFADEKRRSFGLEDEITTECKATEFVLWCAAWDKFEVIGGE